MIFPEGTRIRASKLKEGQDFSKSRGLPIYGNLLVPRVKGLHASIDGTHDAVEGIIDMTVGYSEWTKAGHALPSGALPFPIPIFPPHWALASVGISGVGAQLAQKFFRKDAQIKKFGGAHSLTLVTLRCCCSGKHDVWRGAQVARARAHALLQDVRGAEVRGGGGCMAEGKVGGKGQAPGESAPEIRVWGLVLWVHPMDNDKHQMRAHPTP